MMENFLLLLLLFLFIMFAILVALMRWVLCIPLQLNKLDYICDAIKALNDTQQNSLILQTSIEKTLNQLAKPKPDKPDKDETEAK